MSKMVCDICGTTYDEASGVCPVCGWKPGTTLDTAGDMDDILNDDFQIDDFDLDGSDLPPQKGKAVFDYDAVNTRRRQPAAPTRPARPAPAPAKEDEDEEEEESGSNKFLVIILVVLILALLAVSGYIAYTKLWKPDRMGSDSNKPQETVSVEPSESEETTEPTETTEATEPTIPCTELSLVASMDKLTFAGQYWRLMVKYAPEDTTDKVTFTSGDESVVTVDEYGRVTAVGEGETVIVIQCGDKRIETPAVVSFATETTEATTAAPAEGTSGTGTSSGSTVATPSSGVLKLKKTDITISRRGVYVTLELENGISADSVKWSTSDSSIATVYNGNVTALGRGTCVIRAEYNGQVAECVVRCNF
ncbi:MAG: Ig-like domain-containing protein [Faecousia sp.]